MSCSRFHQFFYAFGALVALAHIIFIGIGIHFYNNDWWFNEVRWAHSRVIGTAAAKMVIAIFTLFYYVAHLALRRRNPNSMFTSIGMDFIFNVVLLIATLITNCIGWAAGGWWLVIDIILFIVQDLLFVIIIVFEAIYVMRNRRAATRSLWRTGIDEIAHSSRREVHTTKDVPVHQEMTA